MTRSADERDPQDVGPPSGGAAGAGAAPTPSPLGDRVRARRRELGLTLETLASRVGCAKSYLSSIETGRRRAPPSERLLQRLEAALVVESGALVRVGQWAQTPGPVRRQVERLHARERAAKVLIAALRQSTTDGAGGLDELHRSGALERLIGQASPAASGADGEMPARDDMSVDGVLSGEIPLINAVQAGYPRAFTDMGYPARVAEEYVRTPGVRDPNAFAIRVVGASMEPEYREGDVVVFSPALEVRDGDDCFARLELEHETTFRRIYFEPGDDGVSMVRLQPLNSACRAQTVDRQQVAGLYAAVCVVRWIRRDRG